MLYKVKKRIKTIPYRKGIYASDYRKEIWVKNLEVQIAMKTSCFSYAT